MEKQPNNNKTMPVSELHNLIRYLEYDMISDRVAEYPDEARILNTARATPIANLMKTMCQGTTADALQRNEKAWALAVKDAISSLLWTYPRGVANVDRHGDTALTIACAKAKFLIYADCTHCHERYYDIILRWAILEIIDACPEAAAIANANGQTPMQLISNFGGGGPMDIIIRIGQAHPPSILRPISQMVGFSHYWDRAQTLLKSIPMTALDDGQFLRVHRLVEEIFQHIKSKVEVVEDEEYRENRRPYPPTRPRPVRVVLSDENASLLASKLLSGEEEYYQKANNLLLLLLRIGAYGTTGEDLPNGERLATFRALHAAASLKIPAQAVHLFVLMYPEQLAQVDETKGWTPLHAASAAPSHCREAVWPDEEEAFVPAWQHKWQRRKDMDFEPTAVHILLQKYPAAASMMDRQGRFPLMLALKSGKTWATLNQVVCMPSIGPDGVRTGGGCIIDQYPAEIEALVKAAPLALRIPDASGIYPFQAAAITAASATNRGSSLDTTYELLRADPSVIRLALHCI